MPAWYKTRTADDGRQLARYFKAQGYDFVKIYGGIPRDGFLGLTSEARALGLAHAGGDHGALG